jgi:hypothetical protein
LRSIAGMISILRDCYVVFGGIGADGCRKSGSGKRRWRRCKK